MKKLYLLSLLGITLMKIQAQTFEWSKVEGLYAYDYGYGVTTDNSGNLYVAGKYEMNANFSGTILPCQGNHDIYVAKYTSSGTLSWITTAGGTLGDYAHGIACDGSYLYVAGEIEGYGNLIKFQGSTITLNSVGDNDIFLAKYDLDGNLLWAKSSGGSYNDKGQAVTYDNSGNVYVAGFFNDTATFGGTTIHGYTNGLNDIFVAKYDKDGNFLWVRQAGSSGRDEVKGVKCDADGNVYICGLYSDGVAFGSEILNSPYGYYNIFVTKYSADGTLQWAKPAGGDVDDVAWAMAIDKSGKIYVTGEYNAYAVFGSYALTATGNADVFVACYNNSGDVQWVKSAGGGLIDRARGIGLDGNNILITGQFGSTASFGSTTLTAADSSDIFMAELDNSGNYMWAKSIGGSPDSVETLGYESGNDICGDGNGSIYATGSLLNGGVFGSVTLPQYSRTDVFITKLSLVTGINELAENKNILLYPNPNSGNFTIGIKQFVGQKIEMNITNALGELVDSRTEIASSDLNIDLSAKEKGIYFAEIKIADQKSFRGKIIVQ